MFFVAGLPFDVYNGTRVDSQEEQAVTGCPISFSLSLFAIRQTEVCRTSDKKSRSRLLAERLSGELLGLTRGCDLRKEGVTVTLRKTIQTTDYYFLRLGLSHLTVI